jgi:hypothetical protein
LDQTFNDESIGYGNMQFEYNFDDGQEPSWPAASPGNYDHDVENPTGLWENDCGATFRHCAGLPYYGGHNQCAAGDTFWRTFEADLIHPTTTEVRLTGKIWTIDSWDGEQFTVEMTDAEGNVMDTVTHTGNNFAKMADRTLSCENSVGGWEDGYFEIELTAPYDVSMGDV